MDPTLLTSPEDLAAYQEYLKIAPGASLWQSLEGKRYQEALGRETRLYGLQETGIGKWEMGKPNGYSSTALVIIDKTAFSFSTWDIPRGPLGSDQGAREALLNGIVKDARNEGAMAVYFSPLNSHFPFPNSQYSHRHEQPEASLILDLTLPEENLLQEMHPKGRYNISVAKKHSVRVEHSQDIDSFYALLKETGGRDAFQIRPKNHYEHFLRDLPGSFLLLAYPPLSAQGTKNQQLITKNSSPIAGLLGVVWEGRGYYYYGASNYASRALMAPYALQWEAIRVCREKGCRTYDLLGISPPEVVGAPHASSPLSMTYDTRSHPWEGVTRFKKQFGGRIETYPPEQEIILRPVATQLIALKRKPWK